MSTNGKKKGASAPSDFLEAKRKLYSKGAKALHELRKGSKRMPSAFTLLVMQQQAWKLWHDSLHSRRYTRRARLACAARYLAAMDEYRTRGEQIRRMKRIVANMARDIARDMGVVKGRSKWYD